MVNSSNEIQEIIVLDFVGAFHKAISMYPGHGNACILQDGRQTLFFKFGFIVRFFRIA